MRYEGGGFTNTATVTASVFESRFGTSTRLNAVNLNAGTFSIYDYEALTGIPNFNSGFDPGDPIPITQVTDGRSVAFVNDLSLLAGRLSIIAGIRWNEFHQKDGAGATIYKDNAFSPSVGVLFKPTENTSIYASYMEALEAGRSAPVNAVNAGDVTAPARSKSYEIGGKASFGSFGATVAVFEITRPSAYLDPDTLVFDLFGRARHRGIEADVFGEVIRGLRVYGSLAYIDAELARDANPALIGNRPAAVPEWAVAGGFDADVPFVSNLAMTGAFRHTGTRFFEAANLRTVDGFTIFDLGLRYGFKLNETDLVARLNVANVFDERYYAGANGLTTPGETRCVSLVDG